MPTTPLPTPWNPTQLIRVLKTFDTSMGTAKVKTDATFGYLKALGNRQGPHALAREYVGTALAGWFGLPVADCALLTLTEADCYDLPRGNRTHPGPAFVSRRLPGTTWGMSADPLRLLDNPRDITRLVVFDTWIRNRDRHPPNLETRKPNYANVFLGTTDVPGRLRLYAIDHTHCFDNRDELSLRLAEIGDIRDEGVYGLFPQFASYIDPAVLAWCAADLRSLQRDAVREIVAGIPPSWEVRAEARDALINFIVGRADYLASRIEAGWGREFRSPEGE